MGKASLVGLLSLPSQELNGRGGICFALLFEIFIFIFFLFFLFFSFFRYVLSVFQPCGRAQVVLVLGSNPLILTLNRSMITANANCELCNSLSRNHR